MNLTRKIIGNHLVSGSMTAGEEIAIRTRPDAYAGFNGHYGVHFQLKRLRRQGENLPLGRLHRP